MNILLISQCDKRALTETRRILDQFGERRGDRTWQTPITQAGLDTLRSLLKKTARKNTAVACHWIRGLDHSELLWIVGDAGRFNDQGAVPTNTTTRNVLRCEDENDWHYGEDIRLLTGLAALLHDLGKASQAFQDRLLGKLQERNLYRHEWVSLRLFQAFVGKDNDNAWLARLQNPTAEDDACWLGRLQRDGAEANTDKPFQCLPPLAQAIGWLVLTHHRLPLMPADTVDGKRPWLGSKVFGFQSRHLSQIPAQIDASWNEQCDSSDKKKIEPYWHFPKGLPVTTDLWRKRAARFAAKLAKRWQATDNWLANPYVMHLSRLCLMLADHHYSSLTDKDQRVEGEKGYPIFANTDRKTGKTNQPLDEHLLGVAKHSSEVCYALPGFERHLPRLARHKILQQRSKDERFRWQDKAADMAVAMRERSREHGAFIINMASTGCGKTLGNARVMYALADPQQGMRCAFALGLRTLTLQTGRAFSQKLQLGEDDLAIQVGGLANRLLFEHYQQQAEATGSASSQSLLDETSYVRFEGNEEAHPLLKRVMHDPSVQALLAAPLLVCTIDHLTPATESARGGRQIAPMLRLMSGDLVLDEPDDFDIGDLPALTRLVHWAGLLGSRVLLSSATLPPALLQGLFEAYLAGRTYYQRNRGQHPGKTQAPPICCAWIDENHRQQADCADADSFRQHQQTFASRRHTWLATQTQRRNGQLLPLQFSSTQETIVYREFAGQVRNAASQLHALNASTDPHSGKRVSFGLIRMANITPLYEVALALYQMGATAGQRIHLCVYHSQYPLLLRSAIEQRLDATLNRSDPLAVFDLPDIRRRLDAHPESDQLFIVLGSPVTEVGRDHDYDWAIAEPSSMRSLIQLAGRIRRHRPESHEVLNLLICERNLKSVTTPGRAAFCRPGFEDDSAFKLTSHKLSELLQEAEYRHIDARPRIVARPADQLRPHSSLVDLEHTRLTHAMQGPTARTAPNARASNSAASNTVPPLAAHSCWQQPQAMLSAVLQQQDPFRHDTQKRDELLLLPTEDQDDFALTRLDDGPKKYQKLYVTVEANQNKRVADSQLSGMGISPWADTDYMEALAALAEELGMELDDCARRFGSVSLPENAQGWHFHSALGFSKAK